MQGKYNGAAQSIRSTNAVALHYTGSSSYPAPKTIKNTDRTRECVPPLAGGIQSLSLEQMLIILEHSRGDDILAMWQASPAFHRALALGDRLGLKIWNKVREASGLVVPNKPQLPTEDEIRVMLYVLNDTCQMCDTLNASHQWVRAKLFYLSRSTLICLGFSLVIREKFMNEYQELLKNKQRTLEAIGWFNPIDIPGLEFTLMAKRCLHADPKEQGYFIASSQLADIAIHAVQKLRREKPHESEESIDRKVAQLLLDIRAARNNLLDPAKELLENGPIEINHLRLKREKQVVSELLRMNPKPHKDDIPDITDSEWRLLAYKGTEITAREWKRIESPLKSLVQTRQTARFRAMLESYPPPTPSSVNIPAYHGPDDITGLMVGVFPASLFLTICAYMDLDTIATIENSSKLVRNVLGSRAADPTWRAVRRSLGLEASFNQWPERAVLAYAIRRRCFYCSQEGLNLPLASLVLCGDCFSLNVTEIRSDKLPVPTLKVMAHMQSRPFVKSGWITAAKPDGCGKLYGTAYVYSLSEWMKNLPAELKKYASNKLIAEHVEMHTKPFIQAAKRCEAWQIARDPKNTCLIDRRAQ
ncbi:hypothetical protein FRC01_008580, partial [Tulasnella sp. 417]